MKVKKILKRISVFLIICILTFPLSVKADTDGPRNPAVDAGAANGSCSNTVNWGDPGLATEADDTTYLDITGNNFDAGEISDEIRVSDFGFALTNVVSIDGITVEVIGFTDQGGADYTTVVSLFTAPGSNVGDDKASGSLPTSDPGTTYQTFGGTSDDWLPAGTWTEAEVEDPGFGVALCFIASAANTRINIDHVRVTVTYTAAAGTPPTVTTDAETNVGISSATLNGNITATGGETGAGTEHGFAWGTNSSLSGGDTSTTTLGNYSGTGAFSQRLINLLSNKTYYFRAYATNSGGTGYGAIDAGFTTGTDTEISRRIRLFEGFLIRLFTGKIRLFGQ